MTTAQPRTGLLTKTITMLEMQDAMNSRVDPDWLERGRAWHRAIWIECAELMDHYGGWKWWKSSVRDTEQAMLEIVDIWHFGLSIRIRPDRDYQRAANDIVEEWLAADGSGDFLLDVERLAGRAINDRIFDVGVIPGLLSNLERGFDDLYRSYVGKNVLNFFRQDFGYRDGSYIKIWSGREDNEHLVEIIEALDVDDPDLRDTLYQALAARYPATSD